MKPSLVRHHRATESGWAPRDDTRCDYHQRRIP